MRYLVFALAVSTIMLGDFALGAHENMPTGAPSKCLAMKYKTAAKAARQNHTFHFLGSCCF